MCRGINDERDRYSLCVLGGISLSQALLFHYFSYLLFDLFVIVIVIVIVYSVCIVIMHLS